MINPGHSAAIFFRQIFGFTLVVAAISASFFDGGRAMAAEDGPEYEVIESLGDNLELREYPSFLVAETTVEGTREQAANRGFRILAGFIFGDNQTQDKIAMTAPVTQANSATQANPRTQPESDEKRQSEKIASEKISMTAPVLQAPANGDNENAAEGDDVQAWTVTFAMPREYTLETLPKPNDPRITIRETEPKRVAAILFSGRYTQKNFAKQLATLRAALSEKKIEEKGEPFYAFYNGPFTPFFLRRNEIQIEVASD